MQNLTSSMSDIASNNYTLAQSGSSSQTYKLWTLAYIVLFNFFCVIFAIFLWYKIWVKNFGGKVNLIVIYCS
jgi:hypothetical protein